jgi:hypothetical protein
MRSTLAAIVPGGRQWNNKTLMRFWIFGARGSSRFTIFRIILRNRPGWLLVPRDGEATCSFIFFNQQPCAKAPSILSDVRWYGPSSIPTLLEEIQRKALAKCRLGLVPYAGMPYGHVTELKRLLSELVL